jgi:L-aminopeptidase/D-esterase-like protein
MLQCASALLTQAASSINDNNLAKGLVYAGLGMLAIVGVAFGVSELIAFFGIIGSAAVVVE